MNTAYDEKETRNFFKKRGLALALTVGAIFVFIVTTTLVAVFPAVANALNLGGLPRAGLEGLRWVVLLLVLMVALAVLYRVAPNRDDPKVKWVSVGAVVAVVVWALASVVFSLYVNLSGSYTKTYGPGVLAGIVILLMWLWLSIVAVLLGAEINAEMEKQTVKDTTTGPEKPLGERDALKADLAPSDPDPDPDAARRTDRSGRGPTTDSVSGMADVTVTADIDATPEQVWAVLANPATWGDSGRDHQGFAGEAPAQFMPGGAFVQRVRVMNMPADVRLGPSPACRSLSGFKLEGPARWASACAPSTASIARLGSTVTAHMEFKGAAVMMVGGARERGGSGAAGGSLAKLKARVEA